MDRSPRRSPLARRPWRAHGPLAAALVCVLAFAVAACSGSAVVTLTASRTHFLTYRIRLRSIALQPLGGSSAVPVLAAPVTVDFARLVDVGTIVGAASAPAGRYSSAIVTLDYGSAQIVADDGSPGGEKLTAVGASGLPLGLSTLTLNFDPAQPLRIAANQTSSIALRLDLAASNLVDLGRGVVTVTPMIEASTLPIDQKPLRLDGSIASIDAATAGYTTAVAPFDAAPGGGTPLAVATAGNTLYEVDGTAAVGAGGFGALASAGAGTETMALGAWSLPGTGAAPGASTPMQDVTYTATQVLAGSSARSAGFGRLSGVVRARGGNLLTLSGATLTPALGPGSTVSADQYVTGTATVTLGGATVVTRPGDPPGTARSVADLSVGSRIAAYGQLATDAQGDASLDASGGRIQLYDSRAEGLVTGSVSGALTLALARLGGRSAAGFDFTGTGGSSTLDANAAQYSVSTGTLDLGNATVGTPVSASGLAGAFGAAPPDFAAAALADQSTIEAELTVDWGSAGSARPFASQGGAELVIDAANGTIGARHVLDFGAETLDLATLGGDPVIVPAASTDDAVYSIGHAASATIDSYAHYTDFAAALQAALGRARATTLSARGTYAAASRTLTAHSISVYLDD
ncbi:MAG: hypothetical protein KGL34_05980 [Gammaproteobacteria bacterium]|nr:hypothetical protein [Gammaproteobacteria bacterium]